MVSIPRTFFRLNCEDFTWFVRDSCPLVPPRLAVFVKVIWQRIVSPAKYTEPRSKRTSISTIIEGKKPLLHNKSIYETCIGKKSSQ
jgi:hypothetical protein